MLRQIALDYALSSDLVQAQAALDKLEIANPGQMLLSMAEADISAGRAQAEVKPLAQLADALGIRSPKLIAYLAPTPTLTPIPPTATPPPSPTLAPSATSVPPTLTPQPPTPEPPTETPTPEPQQARVVADSNVNLRSGPGRTYPVIGQMRVGQELAIVARNASGDWWQLAWDGQGQAWVAGTVVNVLGPIDTVAVAENISAPPPTPTRVPQPPAPPAAAPAPPQPSSAFVTQSVRVRAVGENSQTCASGEHNIFVLVVDPGGNPLDNVRVREVFTGQIQVTGAQGKGPGRVEFDIYRDGGGQLEIVDDANNPISPQTRGMSANLPDWDLFQSAGYCNCKPYPDVESCRAGWEARDFRFMPMNHYVYEVVFQRTY